MNNPLRILLLEDNPADAQLVQFELAEGGLNFTAKVVMTKKDFTRELQEFSPDIILSDYDLPQFSGLQALHEATKRSPDIPFILVSGAIVEERAIEILTQGARDYVLKMKLQQRLVPAVKRALAEAAEHKARKLAESELLEARRTLEERVKIRTSELEAEIAARRKMEEDLLKNEAMLTRAQQITNMGSWEQDILTGTLKWSDEIYRIFGLTPGEIIPNYENFLALINPENRDAVKFAVEEALAGKSFQIEYSITRPDSTVRNILAHGSAYFDEAGKPNRMVGTALDITARKQVEEALRESEAKYRNLFMNMTEEVHLWKLVRDEKGQIKTWQVVDVNPPALKTWGRKSIEDTIGRLADEIYPGATAHYMPVVQKIMAEGVSFSYEDYFPPPVDKHFRFTSIPLGEYFITTGADITDIKKSEEAVHESKAQLDLALLSAGMGMWQWDIISKRRYFDNQVCRLLGIDPATFTGTEEEFIRVVHPDDMAAIKTARSRTIKENIPYEVTYRAVWQDLSIHYIASRGMLVRDSKGRPLRINGILWDITENQRAEEPLSKPKKTKRVIRSRK